MFAAKTRMCSVCVAGLISVCGWNHSANALLASVVDDSACYAPAAGNPDQTPPPPGPVQEAGFQAKETQEVLPEGPLVIPLTEKINLAGSIFGSGTTAIVLAHSFVAGQNRSQLAPLARKLATEGFTVVTYDARGYGETPGPPVYHKVDAEARAVLSLLRKRGFSRIGIMGVGLGGLAIVKQGSEPEVVGMVLISTPTSAGRLRFDPSDVAGTTYPKLFIAAEKDFGNSRPFAAMAQQMHDAASKPRAIRIYPGAAHSMAMFETDYADKLDELILRFFQEM